MPAALPLPHASHDWFSCRQSLAQLWGRERNRWIDASIPATTGGHDCHPSRALQFDDHRGAVPRPQGRRRAARASPLHGWGGGSVRGGERRPQPGAPGRHLRPPSGRVRARLHCARHACCLTLPRPHRCLFSWSRVRKAVAQVCGASVRG